MAKYYYQKEKRSYKILFRFFAILLIIGGLGVSFYTFLPIFSWQLYFSQGFANQNLKSPIPGISTLFTAAGKTLSVDYTNANNWFPTYNPGGNYQKKQAGTYTISIPSIDIKDAVVSTSDINLAQHLVNFTGTAIPPQNGNAVIFGHSTLPQLYNPKDYKTIFANAYKIKTGDEIFVTFSQVTYKYKVSSIIVVDPEDTSVLSQDTRDSFLTLITCTPPGTVWKRLVIKSQLVRI